MTDNDVISQIEKIRKIRRLREKFLKTFMSRQGHLAIKEIKLRTPVDKGQLRIRFELRGPFVDSQSGLIVMSIVNPQIYGPYIEHGHRKVRSTIGLVDDAKDNPVGLLSKPGKEAVGLIKRDADTDTTVGGYHMVEQGLAVVRETFNSDLEQASNAFWDKVK